MNYRILVDVLVAYTKVIEVEAENEDEAGVKVHDIVDNLTPMDYDEVDIVQINYEFEEEDEE